MTRQSLSMAIIACFAFGCGAQGPTSQPTKTTPSQASTPVAASHSTESAPTMAKDKAPVDNTCQGRIIQMPFDSTQIPKDLEADLQSLVNCLRKSPETKVTLEGHLRVQGTPEYAQSLGDKLADSVAKRLQRMGLAEQRIATISYGYNRPVCQEKTPECDRANHRVEIRVGDD